MRYIFAIISVIMICGNGYAAQLKDTTITGNGTITGNLKVTGMATMTNLSVGTGVISIVGNETIVTYNTSSTFVVPDGVTSLKVFVVGGGAGGDGGVTSTVYGHGGGGGRVTYRSAFSVTAGSSHTVTIGTGGTLGTIDNQASDGVQSAFSTITAAGGTKANNIGSGGDGGDSGNDIDTVVTNYNGLTDSVWGGAGGAGAGGVGGTVSDAAGGTGGAGYSSSITGSSVAYGTGGDGSGTGSGVPSTVVANRGLGGHGHPTSPKNGGSGVVIVRFITTYTSLNVIGKVGIGTSTPAAELHVLGTVTATSFSGNGAQLTGKENTLSNSAGLAAAISDETGTNTVVFNSSPTLSGNINLPGSGIWNSSGSAGIGIASPASRLTILENAADGAGTSELGIGFQYDSTFTRAGIYADGLTGWLGVLHFATNPGANSHTLTPRMTIRDDKVGIGTTTPQTKLSVAGTVTATGFIGNGSLLTGISSDATWSGLTGVPTDNSNFAIVSGTSTGLIRDARGNANLNGIDFIGTTTLYAGGTRTTPLLYSRKTTKPNDTTSNVLLYVPADAGGSSTTFTDYSQYAATFTVAGNAVSSSAWSEFGGASFYASNGSATIAAATDGRYNIFGTDTCYISMFVKMDNVTTNMPFFTLGTFGQTGLYFSGAGGNGLVFSVYSTGAGSIIQGNTTGWSAGVKYHVAVRKYADGGYHLLRDGVIVASGTITNAWHLNKNFILGYNDLPQTIAGFIDDFYWEKNTTGTDVVPTAAKNLAAYTETTTHYIPVGTTTTFLSIVDSGTFSANTKLVLGAAPYSTATTGYGLDAASKAILAKSYVTTPSSSEVKTDLPSKTSPQEEAVDIMRKSKAHKYFYKNKVVTAEIAENKAKEDYLNKQRPSEFELFRALHENEYLEGVTGSMSVNYKKMKDAFEKDYPAKMNIKWNALNDKNNRIVEAKAHLEKDPNDARNNTDNYGIEIDRDCPKEVLNKDGLPVLEKWAGFNYSVNKGLVDLADRQQQEIGSLTAALENMRVINNLK